MESIKNHDVAAGSIVPFIFTKRLLPKPPSRPERIMSVSAMNHDATLEVFELDAAAQNGASPCSQGQAGPPG